MSDRNGLRTIGGTQSKSLTALYHGPLGGQSAQLLGSRRSRVVQAHPGAEVPARQPDTLANPGEQCAVTAAAASRLFADMFGDIALCPQRPHPRQAVDQVFPATLSIALPTLPPLILEAGQVDRHRNKRSRIRAADLLALHLLNDPRQEALEQSVEPAGVFAKIGDGNRLDIDES
jgi:hypothetical protein